MDHVLRTGGFVCESALDGKEAITLVKRQSFRLAFLDAKLLDIDGLELARLIRELDPGLPIVIVSGYFYPEDAKIRGAIESGLISVFISKPFEHQEVLRVVELHGTRSGVVAP